MPAPEALAIEKLRWCCGAEAFGFAMTAELPDIAAPRKTLDS
jgi:hypothetical protein